MGDILLLKIYVSRKASLNGTPCVLAYLEVATEQIAKARLKHCRGTTSRCMSVDVATKKIAKARLKDLEAGGNDELCSSSRLRWQNRESAFEIMQ